MELKELILKAEEERRFAYEKYKMGKDKVLLENAMQYYMDMSNAFLELLEGLKNMQYNELFVCPNCKSNQTYLSENGKIGKCLECGSDYAIKYHIKTS